MQAKGRPFKANEKRFTCTTQTARSEIKGSEAKGSFFFFFLFPPSEEILHMPAPLTENFLLGARQHKSSCRLLMGEKAIREDST